MKQGKYLYKIKASIVEGVVVVVVLEVVVVVLEVVVVVLEVVVVVETIIWELDNRIGSYLAMW